MCWQILVIVTESASQEICWQKLGGGVNLLTDLVTMTKSAQSDNLLAESGWVW